MSSFRSRPVITITMVNGLASTAALARFTARAVKRRGTIAAVIGAIGRSAASKYSTGVSAVIVLHAVKEVSLHSVTMKL